MLCKHSAVDDHLWPKQRLNFMEFLSHETLDFIVLCGSAPALKEATKDDVIPGHISLHCLFPLIMLCSTLPRGFYFLRYTSCFK